MLAVARLWPVAVLLAAAGVFALATHSAGTDDDALSPSAPLTVAALFAFVLGAVVFAARAPRRARRTSALVAACLSAAAALLAAAPVAFPYYDGCNHHDTLAPALLVPAIVAVRPGRARLAYGDGSTLMLCVDRSDLPPLPQ